MSDVLVLNSRVRTARQIPYIFAILNVTPDSFSDGGDWDTTDAAIARGLELREQGADFVDVGGESTRPGSDTVPPEVEQERVLPVVRGLVERGVRVSIDTRNASTARAAAEAGAEIINDVSGGLHDPEMYRTVAATGLHYVAMHSRGESGSDAEYGDVARDVRNDLKNRIAELIVWGVRADRIILDPGVGFSKTSEQSWRVLGHIDELATLGYPIFVGASRKRFLAEFAGDDAFPTDRDTATSLVSVLAASAGAWAVRVHDVPSTKDALAIWHAWERGSAS